MKQLSLPQQDQLKRNVTYIMKTYKDPSLNEVAATQEGEEANVADDELDNLKEDLPLPDGVLKVNLGIPIIIVCTRAELLLHGDRATFLEKNIDFIQKHLRQYCLQYGAALVFLSIKHQINVELLYSYVLSRIYGYHFTQKPELSNKSAIFIPSGFDSPNLITELSKNTSDQIFEEIIKKP